MPLVDTVTSMLLFEYERFMSGLAGLAPEEQTRRKAETLVKQTQRGGPKTINIPGWDDVIHLAPKVPLERADYDAQRAALREGRPSPLSPEKQTELQRRARVRDRMLSSAQPEYAKSFGQIMTAIDNVQDFLTTLSVVGRLAVWPLIHTLDAVGPGFAPAVAEELAGDAARRAAAIALSEATVDVGASRAAGRLAAQVAYKRVFAQAVAGIGTRTLGRLVPGIGLLILAGDLLNLLNWVGQLALPGYALLCGEPLEAFPSALPAAVTGRALKLKAWNLAAVNPWSAKQIVKRRLRLARALPTFGNLIEVAQTSDQLFGVGLSLGGIVGLIMEGAYGGVMKAKGEDVEVRGTPAGGPLLDVTRARIEQLQTPDLRERRNAARIIGGAPQVLRVQEVFTEQEHVEQLAAYLGAWDLIAPDVAGVDLDALVTAALDVTFTPPAGVESVTAALIEENPRGFDSVRLWAFPGSPATVTGRQYIERTVQDVPGALRAFMEPRRASVVAMFYGALVGTIHGRLWRAILGPHEDLETAFTPQWRVLSSLLESGRLVNVGDPPEKIAAFWSAAEALVDDTGRTGLTPLELDALAATHGLVLIPLAYPPR